jgi:UDP:flavonoid glycosyltransferase YjiC (YdhE family)
VRILLAWELGGGQGHVMRLTPIAEALLERGVEVIAAVRSRESARPLCKTGLRLIQSPRMLKSAGSSDLAFNYAELLIRAGYDHLGSIRAAVAAWRTLIETTAPDLVVADFAPGALLGAVVADVPAASVGTGFAVPPPITPLPSIRPWQANPAARMIAAERDMLDSVNLVLAEHGRNRAPSLGAVLNSGRDYLCVFPELDHYQRPAGAAVNYTGPIYSTARGVAPPWPDMPGERIFAYLDARADSAATLASALQMIGSPTVLVARGAPRTDLSRFTGPSLSIINNPVDLEQALATAALVVCHGGMGLVSQALMAGIPLAIKPENPEQRGTGVRVAGLGIGTVLSPRTSAGDAAREIRRTLTDRRFKIAASAFAASHREYDVVRSVSSVADALVGLRLSRSSAAP